MEEEHLERRRRAKKSIERGEGKGAEGPRDSQR